MLLTLMQLNFRFVSFPVARAVTYPPATAKVAYPPVVATVQAPKA